MKNPAYGRQGICQCLRIVLKIIFVRGPVQKCGGLGKTKIVGEWNICGPNLSRWHFLNLIYFYCGQKDGTETLIVMSNSRLKESGLVWWQTLSLCMLLCYYSVWQISVFVFANKSPYILIFIHIHPFLSSQIK